MKHVEMIEEYLYDGSEYQYFDNHGTLIRCEDCRFYHNRWDGTETHYYEDYWCHWVEPSEDDYCSLAERREE